MDIEVYDEREVNSATLTKECDAEALALLAELGLTQQVSEAGTRIAYPKPTADQAFVMEVLFPTATKLQRYDAGSIPLRVLKEIKTYRADNPSHLLIVRHSPPAMVKDPILLAWTGNKAHEWLAEQPSGQWDSMRLIARWGDALDSWATLAERAADVMTARTLEKLSSIVAQCEQMQAAIKKGNKVRHSRELRLDGLEG